MSNATSDAATQPGDAKPSRGKTYRAARSLALVGSLSAITGTTWPWFAYPQGDFGTPCSVPGLEFAAGKALFVVTVAAAISCGVRRPSRRLCVGWLVVGILTGVVTALSADLLADQQTINNACGTAFRFGLEYQDQWNPFLMLGCLLLMIAGVLGTFRRDRAVSMIRSRRHGVNVL